jgi:hypothetical protein
MVNIYKDKVFRKVWKNHQCLLQEMIKELQIQQIQNPGGSKQLKNTVINNH